MPSQRHHDLGDLFVKFSISWPESLDPSKIHFLEQALPPRNPAQKFPKNIALEEVEMADPDPRQMAAQDDDMQEDGPAEGEPRVQCANQ